MASVPSNKRVNKQTPKLQVTSFTSLSLGRRDHLGLLHGGIGTRLQGDSPGPLNHAYNPTGEPSSPTLDRRVTGAFSSGLRPFVYVSNDV